MKIDDQEISQTWESQTSMVVAVASDKGYLGYFSFTDKIKEGSKEVIDKLHDMGIKVYLISGDREKVELRFREIRNGWI